MKTNPICKVCSAPLNNENWCASRQKRNSRLCKGCHCKQMRAWRKSRGHLSFKENKECANFLGVHVAERVLSYVFDNVERTPMNTPGYDLICNRGMRIDVKSGCINSKGKWSFNIKHNVIADYFICLAFDNRKDLNILYMWLIPGNKVNHLMGIGISPNTANKWNKYKLDIKKISNCCNILRDI